MNTVLKQGVTYAVGILTGLVVSVVWWRLWMYQGFIGPVPVLHWFISADGEGSYDLTYYEMIIHIAITGFLALAVKRVMRL